MQFYLSGLGVRRSQPLCWLACYVTRPNDNNNKQIPQDKQLIIFLLPINQTNGALLHFSIRGDLPTLFVALSSKHKSLKTGHKYTVSFVTKELSNFPK